jgi:hypothetical protein
MVWIAFCTVIVFLITRSIAQTPPARARPLSIRLNPSPMVGDDTTARLA